MAGEMKLIRKITKKDLKKWLRPYAKIIIKHFNTPSELLKYLNLDNALGSSLSIEGQINELFCGKSFQEAKEFYSTRFLGATPTSRLRFAPRLRFVSPSSSESASKFGDFPTRLNGYYDTNLIKELIDEGITVKEAELSVVIINNTELR